MKQSAPVGGGEIGSQSATCAFKILNGVGGAEALTVFPVHPVPLEFADKFHQCDLSRREFRERGDHAALILLANDCQYHVSQLISAHHFHLSSHLGRRSETPMPTCH